MTNRHLENETEKHYGGPTQPPLYIAGPMTGYPQFNIPLFIEVAEIAREQGFEVISPAELDQEDDEDFQIASNSPDGALGTTTKSYGDYLSRDVKLVCDVAVGIIFLPNWEASKGARLEAYVSLQEGHAQYYHYVENSKIIKSYPRDRVIAGVQNRLVNGAAHYNKLHGIT